MANINYQYKVYYTTETGTCGEERLQTIEEMQNCVGRYIMISSNIILYQKVHNKWTRIRTISVKM